VDRNLLRWIAIVAGLVLAGLWLFLVLAGLAVLAWVPPSAAVALALGLALTAL
jgi:hypothetical protein